MKIYVFSSNTVTNIWAGIGAGLWAVQLCNKKELRTKAMKVPVGAVGVLYCVENKSFTTPFVIKSVPEDRIIKNIWPEPWMFPFKIQPLGNPRKCIHKDNIGILPTIKNSTKRWNSILHISGSLAFQPPTITDEDWSILIKELT